MTDDSDVDDFLDSIDPADMLDGGPWRRIIRAKKDASAADAELIAAVLAAREAGYSWTLVGTALDVSKQAAQQRFGRLERQRAAE